MLIWNGSNHVNIYISTILCEIIRNIHVHQLLPLLYVSNVIYQNNLILIPVSWLTLTAALPYGLWFYILIEDP